MKHCYFSVLLMANCLTMTSIAQVKVVKDPKENKVTVTIDNKPFTVLLYPDTLEKPVLFPIRAANGTIVTRGYPLAPRPDDPTDHPHHIGLWFNFENVNGLDFWNNSSAIPKEKKHLYGWIKTDKRIGTTSGAKGTATYHANWKNQNNDLLLEETTRFEFSGNAYQRIIERTTVLTANTDVKFTDAKDGMLAIRVAHALEIPQKSDKKFTDDKGIATVVKGNADHIAGGNYLTSEGKTGDGAWGTRAVWVKMFGKMDGDSISVVIIDHPKNINYPTYWHARGYGLFAANPLGEKIFTNGKSEKNLTLKKGETATFRYMIVIHNGKKTLTAKETDKMAKEFGKR
ncbi:MAG: hypothetical protein CRN43_08295 [Candidatus Nephrothrix sp. EaCA]|nr:MAG: hypothetical protein CRN43_08295 [Candidatus Nephrothrix sp. EaCA]